MPFKSDKQRRFLWSQKPEVARKFAEHKNQGGPLAPRGVGVSSYDFGRKYNPDRWNDAGTSWTNRMRDRVAAAAKRKVPTTRNWEGRAYFAPGSSPHINTPHTGNNTYADWFLPAIDAHEFGHAESDITEGSAADAYSTPGGVLHEEAFASRLARDQARRAGAPLSDVQHQFLEDALGTYAKSVGDEWRRTPNFPYDNPNIPGRQNMPAGRYYPDDQLNPAWFTEPKRYKEWVGPRDEVAKDYADWWFNKSRGKEHHDADAGSDVQAVDIWHAFQPPRGKEIGMGKTTGRDKMYRIYGDKDAPFPTEFPVSRNRPDVARARDAAIERRRFPGDDPAKKKEWNKFQKEYPNARFDMWDKGYNERKAEADAKAAAEAAAKAKAEAEAKAKAERERQAKKDKYEADVKSWEEAGAQHKTDWEKARPDRLQDSLANHPYGKPEIIPGESVENFTQRWDQWRDEVVADADKAKYPGYDVPRPKDPFAPPLADKKKKKKKKKSGGGFFSSLFGG